jgi:hypothetical protein
VRKVVKALEEVAQGEQLKLQEEMLRRESEMANNPPVDINMDLMVSSGDPLMMSDGGDPSKMGQAYTGGPGQDNSSIG